MSYIFYSSWILLKAHHGLTSFQYRSSVYTQWSFSVLTRSSCLAVLVMLPWSFMFGSIPTPSERTLSSMSLWYTQPLPKLHSPGVVLSACVVSLLSVSVFFRPRIMDQVLVSQLAIRGLRHQYCPCRVLVKIHGRCCVVWRWPAMPTGKQLYQCGNGDLVGDLTATWPTPKSLPQTLFLCGVCLPSVSYGDVHA